MFSPGREVRIETKDRVVILSRLEYAILLLFRDWIKEREQGRLDEIKAMWDFLDAEQKRAWTDEAKQINDQMRAFSFACPLAQKYLGTELGIIEILYHLMQKHQPGATRDDAFRLLAEIGAAQALGALKKAQGTPPAEKNASTPAA